MGEDIRLRKRKRGRICVVEIELLVISWLGNKKGAD
jgi:hypothetical protein